MAQYIEIICERERADRWVNQQVRDMSHVPDTIFKYIPFGLLKLGAPLTLRATQPVALNDVMEANLSTFKADATMSRDRWYETVGRRLRQIFGETRFRRNSWRGVQGDMEILGSRPSSGNTSRVSLEWCRSRPTL